LFAKQNDEEEDVIWLSFLQTSFASSSKVVKEQRNLVRTLKSIKTEELIIKIENVFLNNPPKNLFVKTTALKNCRMILHLNLLNLFMYQKKIYLIMFDLEDTLGT
jgi:hypothetical protein